MLFPFLLLLLLPVTESCPACAPLEMGDQINVDMGDVDSVPESGLGSSSEYLGEKLSHPRKSPRWECVNSVRNSAA